MITNLVAVIALSVVTNVSERFTTHLESLPCPEGRLGCLVFHGTNVPDADPQTKWTRTTVKEQTKLEYTNGIPPFLISERTLSDVEVEQKKKVTVEWLPVATNAVVSEFIFDNWRLNEVITSNVFITNIDTLNLAITNQ